MHRFRLTILRAAIATGVFIAVWAVLTLTVGGIGVVDLIGWALLYFIGLSWVQFLVEREANKIEFEQSSSGVSAGARSLNPLDPAAHYYRVWVCLSCSLTFAIFAALFVGPALFRGEDPSAKFKALAVAAGTISMAALATAAAQSQRLRQSLAMLATYSILFVGVYLLVHWDFGKKGDEVTFELPAGGGTDSIKASNVKFKKIVRDRYVINPYSAIIFSAPPPIDKIDPKLDAETANQYKAGKGPGGLGKGKGKGGGFGSGKSGGTWTFKRLVHSDRNWNRNMGVGGDMNLLMQLKAREPLASIPEDTGSVDFSIISRMPAKKALPLLYICGTQTFAPTEDEKKVLREYLIDKHGMILGDNLGGSGFHNNFVAAMTKITGVESVPIPRDDRINMSPYDIPQLPIVVAHGGTAALGWKIDGRWAVYYHPGALSDAWRDDHSGIKKEVYESCYQLGINILYYAYSEQDSWRGAQQP